MIRSTVARAAVLAAAFFATTLGAVPSATAAAAGNHSPSSPPVVTGPQSVSLGRSPVAGDCTVYMTQRDFGVRCSGSLGVALQTPIISPSSDNRPVPPFPAKPPAVGEKFTFSLLNASSTYSPAIYFRDEQYVDHPIGIEARPVYLQVDPKGDGTLIGCAIGTSATLRHSGCKYRYTAPGNYTVGSVAYWEVRYSVDEVWSSLGIVTTTSTAPMVIATT